jgi:hypothetical protein
MVRAIGCARRQSELFRDRNGDPRETVILTGMMEAEGIDGRRIRSMECALPLGLGLEAEKLFATGVETVECNGELYVEVWPASATGYRIGGQAYAEDAGPNDPFADMRRQKERIEKRLAGRSKLRALPKA